MCDTNLLRCYLSQYISTSKSAIKYKKLKISILLIIGVFFILSFIPSSSAMYYDESSQLSCSVVNIRVKTWDLGSNLMLNVPGKCTDISGTIREKWVILRGGGMGERIVQGLMGNWCQRLNEVCKDVINIQDSMLCIEEGPRASPNSVLLFFPVDILLLLWGCQHFCNSQKRYCSEVAFFSLNGDSQISLMLVSTRLRFFS